MNGTGALDIVVVYGKPRRVAECASCERVRPIFSRGMCNACRATRSKNGTLLEFGYVKNDRVRDYARLRRLGVTIGEAAGRLGVSKRTAERYEADLAAAGLAPWRRWPRAA